MKRNYLRNDELDNASRIRKRSIENGRPVGARAREIYLVRPNAKSAHSEQVRGRFECAVRQVGVAPDPEHVHLGQALEQFRLGQGPVRCLNLVTRLGKDGCGVRVDVLK
jgi:hypothetical protein